MNRITYRVPLVAAVLLFTGCHSAGYRESAYGPPPDYSGYADAGIPADAQVSMGDVVVGSREKNFVDRHPILSAPRNYFRDSSNNLFVKTFYGTVVGIPVGIARETWQIFYGQ